MSSACVPQFISSTWHCAAQNYSTTQYDEAISLTFDEASYSGLLNLTWGLEFEATTSACGVETCAQLEACLSEDDPAQCSGSDNCSCTVTVLYQDVELGGTYSMQNDSLEVVGGWFEPIGVHPYCRDGDVLTIWSPQYTVELTRTPCDADEDCAHLTGDEPDSVPGFCVDV